VKSPIQVHVEEKGITLFNRALERFIEHERMDRIEAIRKVSRVFTDTLIQYTPPLDNGRKNPRRIGEKAVERDIRRAAKPLTLRGWKNPRIREAIKTRDVRVLNAIFDAAGMNMKAVRWNPELHQAVRQSRGRVRRWTGLVTPDVAEQKRYIKRIKEHVGKARGGWAEAAIRLGSKQPGWIARHRTEGSFSDTLDRGGGIRIRNYSDWAKHDESRVGENALNSTRRFLDNVVFAGLDKAVKKAFRR
jgi:hypothetical protein